MTKDLLTLCNAVQSIIIWMNVLALHTVLKTYTEHTLKGVWQAAQGLSFKSLHKTHSEIVRCGAVLQANH